MAKYEYRCEVCSRIEEVDHPMKSKVKIVCCNKIMEKIISVSNFILKGKGWAKDGYSKR